MSEPVPIKECARRYIAKMPEAVSGSGGHDRTYRVACVLIIDFDLPEADALDLLREYNQRCDPPWKEKELSRKLQQAGKEKGRDASRLGRLSKRENASYAVPSPGCSRRPTWSATHKQRRPDPSHDGRDLPLLSGSKRQLAGGVSDIGHINVAEAFPEPNYNFPKPKPARQESDSDPIVSVYGSKAALWGHIKGLMDKNMSRWPDEYPGMRAPNLLMLDPRVVGSMPDVVDGMVIRPGARNQVNLKSDLNWRIKEGKAVYVGQK